MHLPLLSIGLLPFTFFTTPSIVTSAISCYECTDLTWEQKDGRPSCRDKRPALVKSERCDVCVHYSAPYYTYNKNEAITGKKNQVNALEGTSKFCMTKSVLALNYPFLEKYTMNKFSDKQNYQDFSVDNQISEFPGTYYICDVDGCSGCKSDAENRDKWFGKNAISNCGDEQNGAQSAVAKPSNSSSGRLEPAFCSLTLGISVVYFSDRTSILP